MDVGPAIRRPAINMDVAGVTPAHDHAMAITFRTKACGDVTMPTPTRKLVLTVIGKEFGVRGVITAAEAPVAASPCARRDRGRIRRPWSG